MPPAWQARAVGSLLLVSVLSLPAQQPLRLPPYERAQQLRAALEARPESQRTRAAYGRVVDAYRAVYYYDPASPRTDASVLSIAQLLTEEGRLFSDEKILQDAIGRYESLHLQHPSGRYRYVGQIVEGEKQARVALNELHRRAELRPPSSVRAQHEAVPAAAIESQQSAMTGTRTPAIQSSPYVEPSRPPPATTQPAMQPSPPAQPSSPSPEGPTSVLTALHPGQVTLVSGIRHWSTPVYTRIAIDLEDQVAYQAARVPGPDRIYFDLYGARLGPGLNGKSTEVIDDGFLKRIRAAQFSNNVTRIVLDVSSVSDYSAFLLPNPWRLIIDIHGLKPGSSQTTNLASAPVSGQPAGRTPVPSAVAKPPVASPPVANSPQPTAVASVPAGSRSGTQEIAALGQQPNRVQATDHPTTHPIAASVAGTVPASQPDDGSLASTAEATTAPPPANGRSRKKPSPLHPAPPDTTETDDNPSPPTHEADPTAAGERSLVRTLGLKIGRIVIDAGHGGHDTGTTGPGGIEEKQVVLDVALRLGKLLKQRLGADVIFTRDNDTFVPLETRTAIANKAQADLFLSIHANSSPDSSARGVETYYLNFTTSPDALEVAARENAVSNESIHELSDLVKKITLKDKIDESREFAADVQKSLYDDLEDGNPGLRDRGVKKAPFVVLIGANMPSILAEISFLTNSDDARELQQPAYRQRIAESLYHGVSRYISGLSGVRLAQSLGRPSGN
ncbi:MAG TPA: N-acetylmuramoyl-L-alanine amidase [Acidobacteriaceae bacterium]|nr:N-acetylmuramoyl-L-alanine amidase [Acidobacteriaceae bacterium]